MSRDQPILVDQTTEASLSSDAVLLKIDWFGQRFQRRRPVQEMVRPVLVVVVHPVCRPCSPRATVPCARCGAVRPPAVRWDEGPLCDPCYTAALRHRGRCDRCGNQRRLVAPPGPGATTCAGCAGLPATHACTDCGIEDKRYEQGLWVPKTHATWAYAPRMPLGQCPRVAVGGGFARRAVVR
jgi:hypothetical protein